MKPPSGQTKCGLYNELVFKVRIKDIEIGSLGVKPVDSTSSLLFIKSGPSSGTLK